MNNLNDYELIYLVSQDNREAENILLKKYNMLLWKNVNLVFAQFVPHGVEKDDLYQEGLIALRRTFEVFDIEKNVPFFSFANVCIQRSMVAYIRKFTTKASRQFYDSIPLDACVSESVSLYNSDVIADPQRMSGLVKFNESLGELYLSSSKITDFEKNVLVLQVSGYSYTEAGEILGCSAKKIDNTLQKVKKILS